MLFGAAWQRWDAAGAIRAAAVAAALTLGGSAVLLLRAGRTT
ncbi:hypothetical protein [Actinoplanes sp. NPDC049316]